MTQLTTYQDYSLEITKIILDQIIINKISLVDAAAIFYFIENSKDLENLKKVLRILEEDFPTIHQIFDMEQSQNKISTEEMVSKFVSTIIKDNPLLAAQISTEACNPNVTIEDLKMKFPEFGGYLGK